MRTGSLHVLPGTEPGKHLPIGQAAIFLVIFFHGRGQWASLQSLNCFSTWNQPLAPPLPGSPSQPKQFHLSPSSRDKTSGHPSSSPQVLFPYSWHLMFAFWADLELDLFTPSLPLWPPLPAAWTCAVVLSWSAQLAGGSLSSTYTSVTSPPCPQGQSSVWAPGGP
jgi:hypothetical protein